MSATIVKLDQSDRDRGVYAIQAGHVALSVVFYPGDPREHERPWRAQIRFVTDEADGADEERLSGADVNRRAAFLAAVSRYETMVRGGRPLPAVVWADVEAALEEAEAFAGTFSGRPPRRS